MRRSAHLYCFCLAMCGPLLLAGCVDSAAPILAGAKPLLGETARFQLFSLRGGFAREPFIASLRWTGSNYIGRLGPGESPTRFTVHEFSGNDLIVQSAPAKDDDRYEYAVARNLAGGVYLVIVIDEDDADTDARAKYCGNEKGRCRIATPEALYALARATAAKPRDSAGLAIRLDETP